MNLGDGPGLKYAKSHMLSNISRTTEVEKFRMADFDTALQSSLLRSRGWARDERDQASFAKARAEIFPFNIDFRLDHAGHLRDSAAIAEYQKILELDKANTQAWLYLGYAYLGVQDADKALWAFERCAELQPGDPNPVESKGEVYLVLGRYEESGAKCEEALRLKSDFWGAEIMLARLSFMREDYDEAIARLVRIFPSLPSRFNQASNLWWRAYYLLWAGRLTEADRTLSMSAAMLQAEYGFDRFVLQRTDWLRGWIAYERGEQGQARKRLTSWAAALDTSDKAFIYPDFCLGLLDLHQGLKDSVKNRLERMRQRTLTGSSSQGYPGEDFWNFYGHALDAAYLLAMRRPEEIQPPWVWAHNIGTVDPPPRITACWPILHWGNPSIPEIAWVPVPFDIMSKAYVERGMVDSAIASYEVALAKPAHWLGPIIPRYYYRVAHLYEQKGMKEKAIENYTRFLKIWGKRIRCTKNRRMPGPDSQG